MHYRECAFVSVLEEYKGHWKPGHILNILHRLNILNLCFNLSLGGSVAIAYERSETAQVLYVIPVSSILGCFPLVPFGATGAIHFAMRRESTDFPCVFCYKIENSSFNRGDGCRWCYVNSRALGWGKRQ
jgi:hypothetical protein